MPGPRPFHVIRDPLWNTIRLDETAVRIVDTAAFQRLRYIRQLGLAHLVYPGATHTRFDHALGVYHLAVTALRLLRERASAPEEAWQAMGLIPYAALLHDIGHYAFSHALEELAPDQVPALQDEGFFAGPGQVCGTGQAVVAGADDDCVVGGLRCFLGHDLHDEHDYLTGFSPFVVIPTELSRRDRERRNLPINFLYHRRRFGRPRRRTLPAH